MDDLISALIIAIVQGLTEWMPISSSGHLILFEKLLDYSGGLMFDVALHFGTLMAVFVYFGGDIVDIVKDFLSLKWSSENGRLGLMILIATLPAAAVGFLFKNIFLKAFDSLGVVALGFGITGLFLMIASFQNGAKRKKLTGNIIEVGEKRFGYFEGFLVGCAQVLALFPGISRSGATLSSGLLLGLDEKSAMKFSFLMSIPIIFGANVLVIGNNTLPANLIWATLVSFVVGLIAIHLLFRHILTSRRNLKWFAFYALLLAGVLGIWVGIN